MKNKYGWTKVGNLYENKKDKGIVYGMQDNIVISVDKPSYIKQLKKKGLYL